LLRQNVITETADKLRLAPKLSLFHGWFARYGNWFLTDCLTGQDGGCTNFDQRFCKTFCPEIFSLRVFLLRGNCAQIVPVKVKISKVFPKNAKIAKNIFNENK